MKITRESLEQNFSLYNDEELLAQFRSGELTELAQEVAGAELRQRGIDPSKKLAIDTIAPVEERRNVGEGDLVQIARFLNPMDAEMLRSRLDAEGLQAMVADANMSRANPFLKFAIGGVRVLVAESHVERAREIMDAIERGEYALDEEDVASPGQP